MCIVRVILRQLLALPCKLLFVCLCDFLSLPRNCRREVLYWVGAVNLYYLSMANFSLLGCFCTSWPCILNKFWCHWLSFRLAHPNTLFAIYLVPSIRPVVYGILFLLLYCIGTSHSYFASALMLPGPNLWLVICLSACCTSNESWTLLLLIHRKRLKLWLSE